MKKAFLLLALAVIIVGTAFAQKVGDTTQLGGQTYVVESVSGDRVTLRKVSLDGVWVRTVGGNNITVVTFSGTSAVITEFSNQANAAWNGARNNGIINIGDPYIRNIINTGATTWSCEVLELNTGATGIRWISGTITMQEDGTIRIGITGSSSWRVDFKKR